MDQQIRFTQTANGVNIAYATVGQGPPLVITSNWLSHLEFDRQNPVWRHWLEGLAVHHQLIRYDELGSGLSDWNANDFSLDAWLEDLDAVVSAAGLKRFPLLGLSRGAPTAIAYAACYPQRVSHLILCGGYVRGWQNRILARKRKKSWICFTSSFAWVGANPTQLLDRFSQACLYRMALQSR